MQQHRHDFSRPDPHHGSIEKYGASKSSSSEFEEAFFFFFISSLPQSGFCTLFFITEGCLLVITMIAEIEGILLSVYEWSKRKRWEGGNDNSDSDSDGRTERSFRPPLWNGQLVEVRNLAFPSPTRVTYLS